MRNRHTRLDAKLVGLTRFALADALHLGRMKCVKFVLVFGLLGADAFELGRLDGLGLPGCVGS